MDARDRAELEQRLHELEERFRLAMTNAPIGMAISTLDGPWVAVNPALCDLFGYTEEELLGGLSFVELTHPDDLATELELLEELLAGHRSTYALDKRYRCHNGSLVWTRTVVSLVRDRDGTPRYYVAQCLDATEQHLVEQELRRTAAELERTAADLRASDDIRVAFLRATSHELRTPLTVVAGLADTLRRHHTELAPEQVTELLDRLRGQTQRLTVVVSDLLDVDQLTTGLIRASRRPLPLAHVVRTVLEATTIPDRRVDTDLTEVVVPGDLAKLERVVANLLANAVRHTQPDGWIGLRTSEADGSALLVVEDDGTGIPAGFETRIFEPFVQGPQRRDDARPGTGLGLTLVREYVALHGGNVVAENRAEGGARFVIRLPLERPDVPPHPAHSAAGVDHG